MQPNLDRTKLQSFKLVAKRECELVCFPPDDKYRVWVRGEPIDRKVLTQHSQTLHQLLDVVRVTGTFLEFDCDESSRCSSHTHDGEVAHSRDLTLSYKSIICYAEIKTQAVQTAMSACYVYVEAARVFFQVIQRDSFCAMVE